MSDYSVFLSEIEKLYHENGGEGSFWETAQGMYIKSCFDQHIQAIEALIKCEYTVEYCYIHERLSAPHRTIDLHEQRKYQENIDSNIYDMLPIVIFGRQNSAGYEDMNDSNSLIIAFEKPGMAGVDITEW